MIRDEWGGYWLPRDRVAYSEGKPGELVAYEYKPWRLISKTLDTRRSDGSGYGPPHIYVLRPAGVDPDVAAHTQDRHLSSTGGLYALNEHYGLCVHCNELLPCRATVLEGVAQRAAERMARYETPGICPACQEPVTHRQKSETFPNVMVPLGPPVTFHAGRQNCRYSMDQYRIKAAQPDSQLRLDGGELG